MDFATSTQVLENAPASEFSSRWEIIRPLQSTKLRHSYVARSLRSDLTEHPVTLTVCRYEERLLGNVQYVENVRRRLHHEAEMLSLPMNFLPEPVDLFICRNEHDIFAFPDARGFSENEPVLVTEALAGTPIERLVANGPIDEVRALRIALRLCDLLNDLHRWNILAVEFRPEDLLVDETDHDRVWVASAASLQRSDEKGRLRPKDMVVPLTDFDFAAPEVEAGRDRLDRRADIYTLGAMLFHLLTGRSPRMQRTDAKASWRAIGHYSIETRSFVRRCLDLDPAVRYEDTKGARKVLRQALLAAQDVADGRRNKVRTPLPRATAPGGGSGGTLEGATEEVKVRGRAAGPDDPLVPGLVKIALLPVTASMKALRWVFAEPRGG